MIDKAFDNVVVQNLSRFLSDVRAYFGTNDDFALYYDSAVDKLTVEHVPSGNTWKFHTNSDFETASLGGAVAGGGTVNSVIGGSGTQIAMWAGSCRNVNTTTNTAYPSGGTVDAQISTANFPYSVENATVKVGWGGLLQNDTTGEDVSAKLYDIDNAVSLDTTEVTHTGTTFTSVHSTYEAHNPSAVGRLGLKGKVTDGTGTIDRINATVVAELE